MAGRGWTTVHLVWAKSPTVFHARDPFPPGGVVEDPATGAAAAAFGGYLRALALVDVPARVTILQGADMGRPSRLLVDLAACDERVQVNRHREPDPPRGCVYQASVVIPLSLRDPRDARRARAQPFNMDLLKAARYARRSGFVPTRALSGTFSRPGDGATGTRRGTLMEHPQGHRGACIRTAPKPVACCLNCRFVESFTRPRSCRPPSAA